jgi:type II secretory pathway component PulK
MRRHPIYHRHRGVTLLFTLLLLAVVSLKLGQQAVNNATIRISSLSSGFSVQAQWIAQGVAQEWLTDTQNTSIPWTKLLTAKKWSMDNIHVEVKPSSSEGKVSVLRVKSAKWQKLWQQNNGKLVCVENPDQELIESAGAALECLIDRRYADNRIAYVAPDGSSAPADLFTVWGDGKLDLNRASREILSTVLDNFTDAQIDGLMGLRAREPIDSFDKVSQTLSLSADQQKRLEEVGVFSPRFVELLIQIGRGKMQALYHVVLDSKSPGKVLELRVIQ